MLSRGRLRNGIALAVLAATAFLACLPDILSENSPGSRNPKGRQKDARKNSSSPGKPSSGKTYPAAFAPLPLRGERLARAEAALARFASQSQQSLAESYSRDRKELRLLCRDFDRDLLDSLEHTVATGGDKEKMALIEKAIRAALGSLAEMKPEELAARITSEGAADPVNLEMRDACLHLAMLYCTTRDRKHAEQAAAILAKFADSIPKWPIWNPYSAPQAEKTRMSQSGGETFKSEFSAGLWGNWIYFDLIMGTPLVQANAMIADSQCTRAIGAEQAIREMFYLHMDTQRKFSPVPLISNMDAFPIRGKLDFGLYIPDPQLVHDGVRHLQHLLAFGFYADGWWNEATPDYHRDLVTQLRWFIGEFPKGYSDPPDFTADDGTRFDGLDLSELVRVQLERSEAALGRAILPDKTLMVIHDSTWKMPSPPGSVPISASCLSGMMGQGSLVAGEGPSQTIATLHWSRISGHAHFDALGLKIWARGIEIVGGTEYRPLPDSGSSREWHQSTAAQATVVVDGKSQYQFGDCGTRLRKPRKEDAIPGVTDWRARWDYLHGTDDAGEPRLFSTTFPWVQVVEADATRSYDSVAKVTMYCRTIALVKIDDDNSYVVDVFRVKGGSTHDYMLHSCLEREHVLKVSMKLSPMAGTIHKYVSGLQSARTDGAWDATFEMDNGTRLVTFMAGAPGTEVITGRAPAMRRTGFAPFLAVRRTGGDSTFVAVHQPVAPGRQPAIKEIESLPTGSPDVIALKIKAGNRTDIVVSSADRKKSVRLPGGIEARGAFAHIASGDQGRSWAYLVDGDLLRSSEVDIRGQVSHEGQINSVRSIQKGAPANTFVVGGILTPSPAFSGATAIVDMAGEMSWAYRISEIAKDRTGTQILTPDEPGFIIEKGVIKQTSFPSWGFRGKARFRIPGYALMERTGKNPWTFVQTGVAKSAQCPAAIPEKAPLQDSPAPPAKSAE